MLGKATAQEVKRDALFDSGWKFHRGNIAGAEKPDFDDKNWRMLDIPHDWSIEDLPVSFKLQILPELNVTPGTWLFHKGDDMKWKNPELQDNHWEKVTLPASWENHSGYTQDKVYGWYHKEIIIPDSLPGKDILLGIGGIDDVDETYFNGQLIGNTGSFPPNFVSTWDIPRKYRLPKELIKRDGKNVLAIRVYDEYGGGGLYSETKPRVISGSFDSDAPGGTNTGLTVGGIGWYRKHFKLPETMRDKVITVLFDGVYMNSDVWINGHHLGNHPYGYTSFWYDLSKYLNFGNQDNLLAVQVKNEGVNSRWYAGSGIYRHVWLEVKNPVHIAQWGTYITTPQVSVEKASVHIQTTINNFTGKLAEAELRITIVDPAFRTIATKTVSTKLKKETSSIVEWTFDISQPNLWFTETPALYKAVCKVIGGGRVVDQTETTFGIRSIRFNAEKGFFLNGRNMKLKGGCVHENNGPLGSAAFDRAEERRVELLKAAGFNAVRCAHNPPSPAFLDACDRLGIMAIDEAFDMWNMAKRPDDYHLYFKDWWQRDINSMIVRDRNHPCVILWSIGSQIPECDNELGVQMAKQLSDYVHSLDNTRAVTSNVFYPRGDWSDVDPFFAALDVCGYSYAKAHYEEDHQRLPNRVILSTEIDPRESFVNWMKVVDHDYIAGNFEWTAIDYMGEVASGWMSGGKSASQLFPWNVSYCGDIDVCGFRMPRSYYRDVLFQHGCKLSAFVHNPVSSFGGNGNSRWGWDDVKQSWTWPGYEGKPLQVDVYSVYDSVRLLLNDKNMGVKPISRETEFKALFQVPYEKGILKAIGYSGDKEIEQWQLTTADKPFAIHLKTDRSEIKADGQDLCYVTVEITDKNGIIYPKADNLVHFKIEGPGIIMAVGNSNPISLESFQQPYRKAYEGRCLVVIRSTGKAGKITLWAEGEGLISGTKVIDASPGGSIR